MVIADIDWQLVDFLDFYGGYIGNNEARQGSYLSVNAQPFYAGLVVGHDSQCILKEEVSRLHRMLCWLFLMLSVLIMNGK